MLCSGGKNRPQCRPDGVIKVWTEVRQPGAKIQALNLSLMQRMPLLAFNSVPMAENVDQEHDTSSCVWTSSPSENKVTVQN